MKRVSGPATRGRAAPSFYASAQFAGLFVNISIYLRDGKFSTDFPEIHSVAPSLLVESVDIKDIFVA
jgi:hypothetical protein